MGVICMKCFSGEDSFSLVYLRVSVSLYLSEHYFKFCMAVSVCLSRLVRDSNSPKSVNSSEIYEWVE